MVVTRKMKNFSSLTLMLSMLGNYISADDILNFFFLFFPIKQALKFHANCLLNCLLRRQFA